MRSRKEKAKWKGKGKGRGCWREVCYPETLGQLKFDSYGERYLTKSSRTPKSNRTMVKD